MTQPNYNFRRRMFVQVFLWVVLVIVIGTIMFTGCDTPEPPNCLCQGLRNECPCIDKVAEIVVSDKPDQSHKPVTDEKTEIYSEIDWTDPKQRLSVAVEALRQAEKQIARLERYPTTERTQDLASFHQIRAQLLFQITAEAQNIQWDTSP